MRSPATTRERVAVAGTGLAAVGVAAALRARHHAATTTPDDITDQLARLTDPSLRPPEVEPEVRAVTTRNGTRLRVELHGPEDGPLLVLSHGWTCSTKYWWPQVHAFAGECRVIAYDQRGHGGSEPGRGRLSSEVLGDDLSAVLAATVPQGRTAVLVGHSMGAMSIVSWAERHPEEVERYATAVLLASTAMDGLLAESMLVHLPGVGPRAMGALGKVLVSAPTPVVPPSPAMHSLVRYVALSAAATDEQVEFCERIVLDCPPRARARWGSALSRLDIREGLANLTVPTSVLVGTADRLTPAAHARRMVEALRRDGHLEHVLELPDVGHMSSVEAQEPFDAEVRHLLGLRPRA
ncbi:alpha/beta hydrolase [Rhodococcus aerolatus]